MSKTIGTADVDAFAAFLSATGWTSLGGVRCGSTAGPVAADEAEVAAGKLGAAVDEVEIGNGITEKSVRMPR